jgi:hypothetical protein
MLFSVVAPCAREKRGRVPDWQTLTELPAPGNLAAGGNTIRLSGRLSRP